MTKNILFVTGTDTNIGKTLVSAILTKAFEADYWKPIQSGTIEGHDKNTVFELNSRNIKIHPCIYEFEASVSPHLAAKLENQVIETKKLKLPKTDKNLVVEGAGGVMVPINNRELIIDIIPPKSKVVVVTKNYLGTINHTLLTLEALKNKGHHVIGLIVSGESNVENEQIICSLSNIPIWFHIDQEPYTDIHVVEEYAEKVKNTEIYKSLIK